MSVTLGPRVAFNGYEILSLLARGGMANVWLGRQKMTHGLETLVAIKTILPEFSLDPQFQKMFIDEARVACNIDHPNVTRLRDVGEAHGHAYIVMEYVGGESLSRLRRAFARAGAVVPIEISLRVVADLCAGLHAAHELKDRDGVLLNVVHRDVSPQNVLLSDQGVVKLIDFGVAKARGRLGGDTSAGFAKGKVRYMAPEQAGGESIDRRADIWAVGAVLYELLAGRPPIDAPNEVAVLKSLISEGPIDPLPDSVPRGVRDLVMRALSHAPDARYPTAAMMRTAVEDAMVALGLRATSGDVERVVAERLSERIAERRKFIEESVRAVSSQGATAALDIPLEQGSSRDAVSDASVAASTKATSGEMAPSVRARSRYGWAVLGGLVVTAIVGVAIKSESPRARSVESPSVAIIAMSADPAAPKASVISAVGASAEPIVSTWSSATATTASASRRRATPQATARPAHSRDWGGIE